MKIIKRNGVEVDFDVNKIKNAISKANLTVDESERLSEKQIEEISFAVMNRVSKLPVDTSVETIQDIVEEELDNFHASYQLKKNYIIYRYQHNELRKTNTTDQTILSLINCENEEVKQENSNKNPVIISTQRDYMAGEVSKDLVRRYFMDADLMKAHDEGLIHIHDMDYIAQNCHNCFTGDTLFVSDKGLCRFDSFHDGETVFVKDLHGVIRQATVHKYGRQKFRKVTLYSGHKEVTIKCTANHRWVLSDGSITTNLKVGDTLYKTEDNPNYIIDNYDDALSWCYGFIIGDGCDCSIRKDRNLLFTKVRLCGSNKKDEYYKRIFEMAGFHISEHLKNGDVIMSIRGSLKQDFINGKAWRFLSVKGKQFAFHGYYAANGDVNANKITTSDDRLLPFIMECSGLAGYYISSMNTIIHDTNFKKQAKLHQIYFITNKPLNLRWKVKSIKENCFESTAWCVEEPETHTFTLNYGIVTGNCDLINLEDMLNNGTVISGTKIDKPHSFSTACNIATQIVAQVASSQYGGQSISLTHLAPFVQISRNSIRKEILEDFPDISEEKLSKIVEKRLHKEIEKGVQIIQYQVVTLMTTNGQAPFITVFMYLNEAKDEQTKSDLALIIEEVLKQRIIGVKNEKGVFITPAFPKLVYVLQKDNIYPDGKYFYLSELAAKCTAKRLVPDYISEKKMMELKEGNCFPVMGCLEGKEVVTYKIKKRLFVTNIRTMWNNILNTYGYSYSKLQPNNPDVRSRFIDCRNLDVEIYDSHEKRFVKMFGANRNVSTKFVDVNLSNGRSVTVTEDHPFTTTEADIVLAKDLKPGMQIESEYNQYSEDNGVSNDKVSWLFGLMITNGYYDGDLTVSLGCDEVDIRERFISYVKDEFGCDVNVKLQDRGHKGKYYDLTIKQNTDSERLYISKSMLRTIFSGKQKIDRQIPSYVFETSKIDRISMLAGMIDGDGYINHESGVVQIGSTNKTLALQQMMLAQSCGMPAKIYKNHYNKRAPSMIRYRVEFLPSEELISAMSSEKKKINVNTTVGTIKTPAVVTVISVEENDYVLNSDGWAYSYDVTTESEHFTFSGIYSHNCRSCLSPWKDENGNYKFYGRFNQGVCTINLIDIACSSEKDIDKFWKLFDERLEMCKRVLMIKHKRLLGTKSDVAPILWQNGALARLKKGETIDKLLFGGYSTISLGYAGLYECVYYMTGKSHTDPSVKEFALSIMQHLNDACDKWKHETNIAFSVYGTPLESVTYKFAKCLKKRFGVIPEVTDHDYITNSYHQLIVA